jgi:hypothetical protein
MSAPLESNFLFPGRALIVPVVVIVALLVLVGVYLTVRAFRR